MPIGKLKERRKRRQAEGKWTLGEKLTKAGRERAATRKRAKGPISKYTKVTTDAGATQKEAARRKNKVVKSVKTKGGEYKVYEKGSEKAKSFRQAFATACKGKSSDTKFTWDGRSYSCKRK